MKKKVPIEKTAARPKGKVAGKSCLPANLLNPEHESNGAGVDIGASEIVVAIPSGRGDGPWERAFPTFTTDLNRAAVWLSRSGIRSVVMESTASYWIPVYDIFTSHGLEVQLVNAHVLKHVPGRKSDYSDARWLQMLHSHGLLRGAFRPPEQLLGLRSLIRHLTTLTQESTRHLQRMGKLLTEMNIRLNEVISTCDSQTAQDIIGAIVAGERDPQQLARFRQAGCKHSREEFQEAMTGHWREETVLLLTMEHQLWQVLRLHQEQLQAQITKTLNKLAPPTPPAPPASSSTSATPPPSGEASLPAPSAAQRDIHALCQAQLGCDLTSLPGIGTELTLKLLGELGSREVILKSFPDGHAFAAWMRLAPRPAISGGKILHNKHTSQNRSARIFQMAAKTLGRGDSLLDQDIRRRKAAKGKSKGITIIAHKLARIAYAMIQKGCDYSEQILAAASPERAARHLKHLSHQAQKYGFELIPTSPTPAS